MRTLLVSIVFVLSGCSFIMPKPHDPVMFDRLVSIKLQLEKINCSNKDWGNLLDRVEHIKVYAKIRNEPQAAAFVNLEESLTKAYNSKNEKFCESIINLNKTRIEVVMDAWKGR